MTNTYITSDCHFSHKKILQFQPNRKEALNCETIEEMNEALIKHWNETVNPEDTIYHLGDFMFPNKDTKLKDIVPQLNGKKIFILGNHDNKKWFESLNDPTLEVHQYLEIKYNGFDIVMFHYPIAFWNKAEQGSLHFFGHTHNSYNSLGKSIDCGFDVHNRIITIEEAIQLANVKEINKRTYHK